MQAGNQPLTSFGIPQDIIDMAQQLKLDATTLLKLCVSHSVEAARDWLQALTDKLPSMQQSKP